MSQDLEVIAGKKAILGAKELVDEVVFLQGQLNIEPVFTALEIIEDRTENIIEAVANFQVGESYFLDYSSESGLGIWLVEFDKSADTEEELLEEYVNYSTTSTQDIANYWSKHGFSYYVISSGTNEFELTLVMLVAAAISKLTGGVIFCGTGNFGSFEPGIYSYCQVMKKLENLYPI